MTAGLLALAIAIPTFGAPQATVLEARLYQRGDAVVLEAYGEPLCIGGRWAEYDVEFAAAGNYLLAIRYAAAEPRATRLLVDGILVHDQAVAGTTGSWVAATGKWEDQAILHLSAGLHTLRIERDPCLPHLTALRLTPTEAPAWLPMLARRQAALHRTLADVRGALEKFGGTSPATQGLLQEAADLSTAVQRADIGNATAEAARAMDELEGRMRALRLPVVGLRTEALAGHRDRLVAWAGDPQVKVFRDSLLPEVCATGGLRMEACRNTYEAAVVCVSSFDYTGPLRVAVTPLTQRGGGRALTATARFVGYVRSAKNTPGRSDNLRPAPAEYPDPLLLDSEVRVQPRSTQPVWVTVRVPAEARPGEYSGALTLGAAGAPQAPFPIRLRVLRPVLPNTPTFRMGSWGGDTFLAAAAAGKPRDYKAYDDAYFAFLKNECLRNRYEHRALVFSDAPLWSVFSACRTVWRDNAYAFDPSLFDRFVSTVEEAFGSEFRIICVGIAAGTSQDRTQLLSGEIHATNPDGSANAQRSFANVPTDDPAYRAFLGEFCRAMERHLREKGWLGNVYFKVLDEITGETLPAALRLRAHIKACAPEIETRRDHPRRRCAGAGTRGSADSQHVRRPRQDRADRGTDRRRARGLDLQQLPQHDGSASDAHEHDGMGELCARAQGVHALGLGLEG